MGAARELRVQFGDPEDDAVERREQFRSLGPLQPGEAEEVRLTVRVRDPATHPELRLRVRANDVDSGESTAAALVIPLQGPGLQTGWLIPPKVTLSVPRGEASAPPARGGHGYRVQGRVEAAAGLTFVQVRLGGDKIFSRSAETEAKGPERVDFDAPAVLERGPNRVWVQARSSDGVEIHRSGWVLGEKAE